MAPTTLPYSTEAEKSVVGALLTRPKLMPEVIGTLLQPDHFYHRGLGVIFDDLVDAHYTGKPTDILSVGERVAPRANEDASRLVEKLRQAATVAEPQHATAHATLVRRDHDRRTLIELATDVAGRAQVEDPEQLAAEISKRAMHVATNTLLTNEILSYSQVGRRFVQRQREMMAARAAGIELGVKFDLKFLDDRMHGLKPTELWILAGEPGVGKSAVAFAAAVQFARRQMRKPADQRIGTLILSLEMGESPTADRLAQSEGGIDSAKLRDGSVTEDELGRIVRGWKANEQIPLYFNFTSMLRASQARALISEAIRRYNVGFVVVDHMRYFNSDERYDNAAEEDEAKARFLKESVAKDLDCVVALLAHTTKAIENRDDRRPRLSDLRGGGMVAAHADFVSFAYSNYRNATEEDVLDGKVARTDMEMIFEKNRHGLTEPTLFTLDPSVMWVRDRI